MIAYKEGKEMPCDVLINNMHRFHYYASKIAKMETNTKRDGDSSCIFKN